MSSTLLTRPCRALRITVRAVCCGAALVLLLAASGCEPRKERIRVQPDGTVELRVEPVPSEFNLGERGTREFQGWRILSERRPDGDGEKEFTWAEQRIMPGRPLPESYADRDDPNGELERRPDGVYYHFRRVYQAREAARFDYLIRKLQEGELFKELQGKEFSEIDEEQRLAMVTTMREIEIEKRAQFIRIAAGSLREQWPMWYETMLYGAMRRVYMRIDVERIVRAMAEEDGVGEHLEELGKRADADVYEALHEELRRLGARPREIEDFFTVYDTEVQRRDVTERLAAESWQVELELPGEVIAHNGELTEEGTVRWLFTADAMHDRDQVLMASSRSER